MILAISAEQDVHARAVMSRLTSSGRDVELLDLAEFPARSALTIDFDQSTREGTARLRGASRSLRFDECRVIWWRRPQPFTVDPQVTNHESRNFALVESHSAISGLWLTLDAFWINHPTRDEEAARKVHQLRVASRVGLRIPETRITNNREDALQFIEQRGPNRTVYKAFAGTENAWRETRLVKPHEMELLENVRFAPVIFQEYVPAGVDLRITVIGDQVFAAAIHSKDTEYEIDFRMVMSTARFESVTLPGDVAAGLHALMARLGLVFGAIDMRVTPDGEYYFLEINPAGQWLFVEGRTGQPITAALADLMLARDAR